MNMRRFWLAGCTFAFSAGLAFAVPRYVSPSGGNVPPYDTWEKAATTIQPAISACAEGDEVIVTNGVYATGGVAVFGAMTNRIAITNAIAVRSVNGPAFTSIVGQGIEDDGVEVGQRGDAQGRPHAEAGRNRP